MLIKSGDSSNFINSQQGVEALVDGLDAGINAAVQQLRQQREQDAYDQSAAIQASVANWQAYAGSLEQQNVRLKSDLTLLEKDYEKLRSKLESVQATFGRYNTLLVGRIRRLDDVLQRQSANEFAYNRMRVRLLEKLKSSPSAEIAHFISDEAQTKALKEDWDYFMKENNVKLGVPDVSEALQMPSHP